MGGILTILLLIVTPSNSKALEIQTITGGILSTTLIESVSFEEERFINTVALHFASAKECWKQRVLPRQRVIDNITVGTILACRRFWPQQPEKLCQFFALIISESGGNNTGNPEDPSYGVCHATTASAHYACWIWGLPHPRNSKLCDSKCRGINYKSPISFKDWLAQDMTFNITCGAGEAAICTIKSKGDWIRAVLIYKFGERGFINAMRRLGDQPITQIKGRDGQYIWKNYNAVYLWVLCLNERASIIPMAPCGCLPPEWPK